MVNVLPLHSHGAAFTQSGLAARRDGRAASPTPAPRSAPRTETTTAAPASAPSSPQEVPPLSPFLPPPPLLLLTPYRLNLSLLITDLFKHHPPPTPFPSAVNVPRSDSCSPCANIKLLLTYSCAFGCCISWAQIQLIPTSFFLSLPASFTLNSPTWVSLCAGWWFEACGPSNLNGIYYPSSSSTARYNSIKWYYWKGPNLVASRTTMMVRPANFWRLGVRLSHGTGDEETESLEKLSQSCRRMQLVKQASMDVSTFEHVQTLRNWRRVGVNLPCDQIF